MSYTSTYALFKTKVTCLAEHRNGFGSGPAIWEYISLKLCGQRFNWSDTNGFFRRWTDPRLDEDERAVLLSTYDRAFVEVEHLSRYARACKKVHGLILEHTHWEWSHFAAIGIDAAELSDKHDYRCRGLAIGCTSVCDPWGQSDIQEVDAWGIYAEIDAHAKSEVAEPA